MKIWMALGTCLLVGAASLYAAPKAAKKPRNFTDLFGKNWTLHKALQGKKDVTKMYIEGKLKGNPLVYTFTADGSMTCVEPGIASCDWKFDEKGLNIHQVSVASAEGQPAAEGTGFYQIAKLTKTHLTLTIPAAKITMEFKAK